MRTKPFHDKFGGNNGVVLDGFVKFNNSIVSDITRLRHCHN